MKLPPVRDPDNYVLADEAAGSLHDLAQDIAAHPGYVKFSITIHYRTREEVESALRQRDERQEKRKKLATGRVG